MFGKTTVNALLMAGSAAAAAQRGGQPYYPYNNNFNNNNAGPVTANTAVPTQFNGLAPSFITSNGVTYIAIPAIRTTIPIGGTITATVTAVPNAVTTTISVPPTQTGIQVGVTARDLEKRQRRPVIGRRPIPNNVRQPRPFQTPAFVPPFANVTLPAAARVQTTTVTVAGPTPTVTATATCSAININVNVAGAGVQVEAYTPIFIGTGVTANPNSLTALAGGQVITTNLAAGLDACAAIAQCASLTANDPLVYQSFDVYLLNGVYVCAQFPAILTPADFTVINANVGASYGYALPPI